mgnify:CR=1 FL=1
MIIFSTILMICGAIATVTGYASIVAIHLDTIDGLFEIGLIALIVGFVMLLVKAESIREVIAFPKVKDASCMMSKAPGTVDEKQLEELGIAIVAPVVEE